VRKPCIPGPSFSWWVPRPSSTICVLLVGAALAVMLTLDQEAFAKTSPTRSYGWPFIYQVELREAMGTGPRPPSRFDPSWLSVDIAISAGILASAYYTVHWLAYRLIGPSRYTVRSSSLTIAVIATLLALCKASWVLTVFILYGAFLYGLTSPLLLVAIILYRRFSTGHGPAR